MPNAANRLSSPITKRRGTLHPRSEHAQSGPGRLLLLVASALAVQCYGMLTWISQVESAVSVPSSP